MLLGAVQTRMRLMIDAWPAASAASRARHRADRSRSSIRESAAALDQLCTMLGQAGDRVESLLQTREAVQIALEQAQSELVGARAGAAQSRHPDLHDGLTALPNRGFFVTQLEAAVARAPRHGFALLYLDLDGFKSINDLYGHRLGDELLAIVAQRLERTLRAEDVVGRIGGDEFACLIDDMPSREQLGHLACKLFDAVSAPMQVHGLALTVSASIGIAMHPADGTTASTLVASAAAAMHSAKRHKSGYAFFDRVPGR